MQDNNDFYKELLKHLEPYQVEPDWFCDDFVIQLRVESEHRDKFIKYLETINED